jgi:hypothetical protein
MNYLFILGRIYVYYIVFYGLIPFVNPSFEDNMVLANQIVDLAVFFVIFITWSTSALYGLQFDKPLQVPTILMFWALIFLCVIFLRAMFLETNLSEVASYSFVSFRLFFVMYLVWMVTSPEYYKIKYAASIQFDLFLMLATHGLIGLLQVSGIPLGEDLVPQLNDYQSSSRAILAGEAVGMFPNSADYGYLGLAVIICLLAFRDFNIFRPVSYLTFFVVFFVLITSGSLACIVAGMFAVWYLADNKLLWFGVAYSSSCLVILFVVVYLEFVSVSIQEKIDSMYLSRLGLVMDAFPPFLFGNIFRSLFGFTPDFVYIYDNLTKVPLAINESNILRYTNDVYILALILSYGLLGAFLYSFLYFKMLKALLPGVNKKTGKMVFRGIILVCLFTASFNQVLILKTFGIVLVYGLIPVFFLVRLKLFDLGRKL